MQLIATVSAHAITMPEVSVGHVLVQGVLALTFVVGGIWAAGKLYARRKISRGTRRIGGAHDLSIISRQVLGKDHQLAVVQWGERQILVGISGSNITFFNDRAANDDPPAELPDTDALFANAISPMASEQFGQARVGITSNLPFVDLASPRQESLLERLRNATQRN